MGFEEPYENWKRTRARVEVPGDFADRVMTSVHRTRRRVWGLLLHRAAVAVAHSRIVRAAATTLALAVCLLRLGGILTIFIPS